jgi:hypothetical protein
MTLALTAVGAVASQVALLTALLYYVGWARAHATYEKFGLDPGLVGYGTEDYVLRSINEAFPPLVIATFAGLALLAIHRALIQPRVERGHGSIGRLITIGLVLGVVLALIVCVRLAAFEVIRFPSGFMLPATLIASVFSLMYFGYLRSLYRGYGLLDDTYARICAIAFLGLSFLGVLWLLAELADDAGERRADTIVRELAGDPAITVYSSSPLAIAGPGIAVKRIGADGERYRYAYTGLRLFESGNGKIILLPSAYARGDNAYVLRDDESIRIDISA